MPHAPLPHDSPVTAELPRIHPKEPPRIELARIPTPMVSLDRLARQIGVERFLVKRDDLTGLETSGNKVRKLEYLLARALSQGCTSLVTHGGFQSNHCLATAAIGARLGLRVRLLLRADEPDPPVDGNLLLDHLLGAQVSLLDRDAYTSHLQEHIDATLADERDRGYRPFFFPVGASMPLGVWGYIRGMAEMAEDLGADAKVDVFCATGSCGTQVGLMIGRALLGCADYRILGVPVAGTVDGMRADIRRLERQAVAEFGLGMTEEQTPIELIDGYVGPGYGIAYPQAVETIETLAGTEGLLLDPVYTGKAMTAMLAIIREKRVRPGATPVFLHTGGAFGLFPQRGLFRSSVR